MTIDYTKIIEVKEYSFENFTLIDKQTASEVLSWRNYPEIRRYMYNKDEISLENHLRFVEGLKDRKDVVYWLVRRKGEPIGVINLTDIQWNESIAELGYYMIPEKMNSGLGVDFVFNVLSFVFGIVKVSKLIGSIDSDNKNALLLDSYMGFVLGNIVNRDNATYVEWSYDVTDFLNNNQEKNSIRNFVKYCKSYNK